MGVVIGVIAFVVAVVAVVAALGHSGYLAMLSSAASKRPGGQAAVEFTKKRLPSAGITLGVTLLALLLSSGGVGADIFAILLGGGGGIASFRALQNTRSRFNSGEF